MCWKNLKNVVVERKQVYSHTVALKQKSFCDIHQVSIVASPNFVVGGRFQIEVLLQKSSEAIKAPLFLYVQMCPFPQGCCIQALFICPMQDEKTHIIHLNIFEIFRNPSQNRVFPSHCCFCLEIRAQKHQFLAMIQFPVPHLRRQISQFIAVEDLIALALSSPSCVLLLHIRDFHHKSTVSMIICTQVSFLFDNVKYHLSVFILRPLHKSYEKGLNLNKSQGLYFGFLRKIY